MGYFKLVNFQNENNLFWHSCSLLHGRFLKFIKTLALKDTVNNISSINFSSWTEGNFPVQSGNFCAIQTSQTWQTFIYISFLQRLLHFCRTFTEIRAKIDHSFLSRLKIATRYENQILENTQSRILCLAKNRFQE